MTSTPFAMMIVNQEIQDRDLVDDEETERIIVTTKDLSLSTEKFLMPPDMQQKNIDKRVRFPSKKKQLATIWFIPRATQEEKQLLWYSSDELDRIQERNDTICLKAMDTNGCRGFLDNAFLATRGDSRRQTNLNCWSRYSENLRGLELVVHKEHSVERYVQKSIHIESVLVAQSVARERMTTADMTERLSRISERCSRRAREFATALGAADQYSEMVSVLP